MGVKELPPGSQALASRAGAAAAAKGSWEGYCSTGSAEAARGARADVVPEQQGSAQAN